MTLHQLRVGLGLWVLMIACGGSPPPAPHAPAPRRDPIPRTGGPTCRAVADHLAVVIGEHAPDQSEGDVHERAMFELRCDTDHWSDEARSCLATVTGDAEADGCLQMLSRDQQHTLAADRDRLRGDRSRAPE